MQKHGIGGRLKFFGEPAEKVRGSKPIHAAGGYYDDLDAVISFHPFYMLPLCNTLKSNLSQPTVSCRILNDEQSPEKI